MRPWRKFQRSRSGQSPSDEIDADVDEVTDDWPSTNDYFHSHADRRTEDRPPRSHRASEPTISYRPRNLEIDIQSRPSNAGSGYPASVAQIHRTDNVNISSTINPLGLTLVHSPTQPSIDFIFVHGLGGSSMGSWAHARDPDNFWLPWLAQDGNLSEARIFTFGYNAAFAAQSTTLNILAFAKDLLFRMRTYSDDSDTTDLPIGRLPIVLVAHSMGGLVVKKAYILGRSDQQYKDMVAYVAAMVFLGTPHKGTNLAATLGNILKATGLGTKLYVTELEKNSNTIQDINEQFRNVCSELKLVSLHETLKTSVGGVKRMVVERESALLEYPNETSSSLVADHGNLSKFRDQHDANYISLRNVLRWLKRQIVSSSDIGGIAPFAQVEYGSSVVSKMTLDHQDISTSISSLLGIVDTSEDDLQYFENRTMQGSCQWLLSRSTFQEWATDNPNAHSVLWVTGSPGCGKSSLASRVVALLKTRAFAGTCQYHFFRAEHQSKRAISYLLRNLAQQIALAHPSFFTRLLDPKNNAGINIGQQSVSMIWEKIFEGILFRTPIQEPLFWVIDGVDEADLPSELIRLLAKIKSAFRINIMLISRPEKNILKAVSNFLPTHVREDITPADTEEDISDYIRTSLQKILPNDEVTREDIVQKMRSKASGSFLWATLALDRLWDSWHTEEDVQDALTELPEGMQPLYERMMDQVATQPEKTRSLAIMILTWTACSFRPFSLEELGIALAASNFRQFTNLEQTVKEVCCHFVTVENSRVILIHETALQFLIRKIPDPRLDLVEHKCHTHIALVCLDFLSDASRWRRAFSVMQERLQSAKIPVGKAIFNEHPMLSYALAFWAYHVSLARVESEDVLHRVLDFLETHCLVWLNGLALAQNLRFLTRAAQQLKAFANRKVAARAKGSPPSLTLVRDGELKQWANDIIRVVARFGKNLLENPSSIYKHVIPFCPQDSIMSRSFNHLDPSSLLVTGLTSRHWDDRLACLSMGEDRTASKILCKDDVLITLVGIDGTLIVWHAETCEETHRLCHGEYVTQLSNSKTSSLVATAGFKTIRVWDIATGEEVTRYENSPNVYVKAIAFGVKDETILIAYDDCTVRCLDLENGDERWNFTARIPGALDHNSARFISFSPDLSQVAIVFRGRPVQVWTIQNASQEILPPRKCVLERDRRRTEAEGDAWTPPEKALWHPQNDHLIIMYEDTRIVDWNLVDDKTTEYSHIGARYMVLSPDGTFLLTSDVSGSLSLWTVPDYRLTYTLKYEELVTDLAFSPDCSRFYDARGAFCNVWEPDALIRANTTEHEETTSSFADETTDTLNSEPTIAVDDETGPLVTALACGPSDKYYCCGREDGVVGIYEIPSGKRARKLLNHAESTPVIKLVWSTSGKYIVSADDSGRVIGKRVEAPSKGKEKWVVFPLIDQRVHEDLAIEQMIFSPKEDLLLIAGSTAVHLVDVKHKREVSFVRLRYLKNSHWVQDPADDGLLLRIGSATTERFSWSFLHQSPNDPTSPNSKAIPNENGIPDVTRQELIRVVRVSVHDGPGTTGVLVLSMKSSVFQNRNRGAPIRHLELLDTTQFGDASTYLTPSIVVDDTISKHVRRVIGAFEDTVVFLDHQFWLCTCEVRLKNRNYAINRHKRHFFLPRHLVSPIALELVVLNRKGTLLCPKRGEVAIIRGTGFGI